MVSQQVYSEFLGEFVGRQFTLGSLGDLLIGLDVLEDVASHPVLAAFLEDVEGINEAEWVIKPRFVGRRSTEA